MKRLILALFLLVSAISPQLSEASGSNTVFLSVKLRQFYLSSAMLDGEISPQLYAYLEKTQSRAFIARVNPRIYATASYYAHLGFAVELGFEEYDSITFRYYPEVDAIVGFDLDGTPVILSCSKI